MYQEAFLRHLSLEKRYSDHTIKAYQLDLDQFFAYLHYQYELEKPQEVSTQMVRSWLAELMDCELHPTSIGRKLSTLKSFFKYLNRESIATANPAHGLKAPKAGKRLPTYVEESAMLQLFDEAYFMDDFHGKRDEMMLTFFYEMGIRIAELISVKDADVDVKSQQVRIIGKRNKERIVPVGDKLLEKWSEYKAIRDDHFGSSSWAYSFCTDTGKKLYPKFVFNKVNGYLGEVSTLKKKSPHVLRHTFATHMLNNGADLNTIKTILGHASLAATQVYTHNSIEQLKNIHKQTHPRG